MTKTRSLINFAYDDVAVLVNKSRALFGTLCFARVLLQPAAVFFKLGTLWQGGGELAGLWDMRWLLMAQGLLGRWLPVVLSRCW